MLNYLKGKLWDFFNLGPIFPIFFGQNVYLGQKCQASIELERYNQQMKNRLHRKDPYRDRPVSVYLNNCKETVAETETESKTTET